MFGIDNSFSEHIDNNKSRSIVLGEGPTQGIDDTTISVEAKYSINFSRPERAFFLSLHYNGNNSFLFVNATKIHKFKAKLSETKPYLLCLVNISKDFTFGNMKKKEKRIKWLRVQLFC